MDLMGDIHPDTVSNYTQTQTLGGQITAQISVVYDSTIEEAHYFGSQDVDDPDVFWMYKITSMRKKEGQIELTGIYILFDELQGVVVRDVRPQGVSAYTALGRILQNTGWQVGIDNTTGTANSSYYYQTVLSAFWDVCEVWNIEFKPRLTWSNGKITSRVIDIYDQLSGDYGKWYEYGDKLITIEAEQTNNEIFTALIGMGKGEETEGGGFGRKIRFDDIVWSVANGNPVDKPYGQDYVALPEAVEQYGFREGVIDFPDVEDRAELLNQTYQSLLETSRPKVQFSADALEMELVEIGETVTIVRDDLGIRYKTRVFEIERNFLDKQIKKFKFGDRVTTSSSERIKTDKTNQKKQEQQTNSRLEAMFASIEESYFNENSYKYDLKSENEYDYPSGTYYFDAPIEQNPSKVIYLGAGKLMIANSKKPDGSWNWRTAATGDGFVAEEMFAGKISADLIELKSNETLVDKIDQINLSNESTQTQLANLMNKDVISPLEKANIETLITRTNIETANIKIALSDSDYDVSALATALSNLVNYLNDIVAAEGYSEIETDQFNVLFSDYLAEYQAALNEVEGITQSRITEITSGQIMLGDRIGAYEEQLQLTPELISMLVNRGNGLERAMTLGQEEIAFYLNEIKKVWLGLNGLNADNATINNSLQTGNHIIEKIGTEFTSWRPI